MQLTKTLIFTLIGTAFALPTTNEKRQLATIQGAVTSVQQSLQKLDTAVKPFGSSSYAPAPGKYQISQINTSNLQAANDASTVAAVQTAATDVQSALTKAQTDIQGAQALQLQEALGLQQLATDLTSTATTTVDDLIAKKATFDQLGVSQVVAQQLTAQKQASAGLGQAIVSKVPAIGQGIAQQSIDQITAAIDKGIQAYGGAAGGGA
ncbi:Cell wall mannoprotein 1 [Colletotrichum sp. SAR11_59]|nr:Cell wall mannoprotein 1 [Colletotrichum sp. SAR11_59]